MRELLYVEGGRALERGEGVECSSLQAFQTHPDPFMYHLPWLTLPWQEGWAG